MRIGQVLNDRFQLEERVGVGGMGEVWRATDLVLRRTVAVKLLRLDLADDATARERFRREALTLAALNLPGAARIHDYGEDVVAGDTVAYLVMEFAAGTTLGRLLAARGRLAAAELVPILGQVARTLDLAHRAGIVHRDVKPGNIMVAADGTVTLLDFGIARSLAGTGMTMSGQIMGTLSYVSPEQVTGSDVGPESDVYSLGVVAYECLTGAPPFTGEPVAIMNGHLRERCPDLPVEVPENLSRAVKRALAKAPGERYASAVEFAVAAGAKVSSAITETVGRSAAPSRWRRGLVTAGSVVVVAMLVAATVWFAPWRSEAGPGGESDSAKPFVPEGLDKGTLVDGAEGVLYRVDADGAVYWYRHTDPDGGEVAWEKGSGRRVGTIDHASIVGGCDGNIYAMDAKGGLYWYRHLDPDSGDDKWSAASGTRLGGGFDRYRIIMPSSDGVLLAVDELGDIYWRKHSPPDEGEIKWDEGTGNRVGSGWTEKNIRLASGCGGLVYGLRPNGDLVWHQNQRMDIDGNQWDMLTIDQHWPEYESLVATFDGVIYARTRDGDLHWYRHLNPQYKATGWADHEGAVLNP